MNLNHKINIIQIMNKKIKEDLYKYFTNKKNYNKLLKCQAFIKGYLTRLNRLPNILYYIQHFLKNNKFNHYDKSDDGRINSCIDEDIIVGLLVKKYSKRIYRPKKRMWYDILIYDYIYEWIPVNIKSTTTTTHDNTGNLAICVYAYTNKDLDLYKSYKNGDMSKILVKKLKKRQYNYKPKKDYYFIVLNKKNRNDVIINSIKGLTELTPNVNNLPFQICWSKNKKFIYKNINTNIELLLNSLQKPKKSWKEDFMSAIRKL